MGFGTAAAPARHTGWPEPQSGISALYGALLAAGMLAVALAWSRVVPHLPVPEWMVAVALVGLALVSLLAFVRFEAAVLLGLVLLGVVKVEPAPPDAVFAIVLGIVVVTGRSELARMPRMLAAILGVLVLANLLSMTQARDPAAAVRFFAITLYLAIFCVWFTAYLDRARRARAVVIGYGIAAVSSAIIGALALLTPLPHREFFLLEGCCRAEALFQDANVFGPFLIPPLLILLHEALVPRLIAPRHRWLVILSVVLLELGVLLSFSRAAWLNLAFGTIVMIVVLALRPGGFGKAFKLTLGLLAVSAVVLMTMASLGETDFLHERASVQNYDAERFASRDAGVQLAQETPLGIGPGQYGLLMPFDPHNVFVLVAAEQGWLGLVGWVAFWVATLFVAGRNALAGRSTHGIASGALLGAWCGLIVNSMVVDSLHWRHVWLLAALIWAADIGWRGRATAPAPAPA
jgi:O-antigen ligase